MSGIGIFRGLSLSRPWPWAFIYPPIPKRAENRDWQRRSMVSSYLALHAAKSWDEDGRDFIANVAGMAVPPKGEHPHSVIFAVCRVSEIVCLADDEAVYDGLFSKRPEIPAEQEQWSFGPYVWLLDSFVVLPKPVECKGAQGLWVLPSSVLTAVREQYKNDGR